MGLISHNLPSAIPLFSKDTDGRHRLASTVSMEDESKSQIGKIIKKTYGSSSLKDTASHRASGKQNHSLSLKWVRLHIDWKLLKVF